MKKSLCTIGAAVFMMAAAAVPAMAGWNQGTGTNASKWWYSYNADGSSYAKGGWAWLDGNNDGVAECYYFDTNGWALMNTKTPDGYTVNANGAWVLNGKVQTKTVSTTSSSSSSASSSSSSGKTTTTTTTSKKNGVVSGVKAAKNVKSTDKVTTGSSGSPKSGTDDSSFDDWSKQNADPQANVAESDSSED